MLHPTEQSSSASEASIHRRVSDALNVAFGVVSEGETLATLALIFSSAIMAFSPNVFRLFLIQEGLKLVPFGSVRDYFLAAVVDR